MQKDDTKFIIFEDENSYLLTNKKATRFWTGKRQRVATTIQSKHDSLFKLSEELFFDYPKELPSCNVHLFGFPTNDGTPKTLSSVNQFPTALRKASRRVPIYIEQHGQCTSGIFDYLRQNELMTQCLLKDYGDLHINANDHMSFNEILHPFFQDLQLTPWQSTICGIGGDHSVSYYIVTSLLKCIDQKILFIQFDAHHDCGVDLLRRDRTVTHNNFVRFLLEQPQIAAVIQIGVRGLRALGQRYEHPKLIQLPSCDQVSLRENLQTIMQRFSKDEVYSYLSFDVDVMDPKDFPLVDFPKIEGPSVDELITSIQLITQEGPPMIGVDVVEGQGDGELDQYDVVLHILAYLLDGLSKKRS